MTKIIVPNFTIPHELYEKMQRHIELRAKQNEAEYKKRKAQFRKELSKYNEQRRKKSAGGAPPQPPKPPKKYSRSAFLSEVIEQYFQQ